MVLRAATCLVTLFSAAPSPHLRCLSRLAMPPKRGPQSPTGRARVSMLPAEPEAQAQEPAPSSSRKRAATTSSPAGPSDKPTPRRRSPAAAKALSATTASTGPPPAAEEPTLADEPAPSAAGGGKSRAGLLAAREAVPCSLTPRRPPLASSSEGLTLVSWNVNGLRAWLADEPRRAELASTALAACEAGPDLIFLLETKLQAGPMEEQARAALAAVLPGYEAHFCSSTAKKGYSGVCALVRAASALPLSLAYGIGEADDEGRAITARLRLPGSQPLDVLCAYVPNSGDGLKRLAYRTGEWDPALRRHVGASAASGACVCVLGDLNVAHLDADIWNWGPSAAKNKALGKNAGLSPEERASFGALLSECALADAFRHLHPQATGAFSYWSVRASGRPVNRGLRLDYALLSAEAAARAPHEPGWRLHDCFMLHEHNSRGDHAAIAITLACRAEE